MAGFFIVLYILYSIVLFSLSDVRYLLIFSSPVIVLILLLPWSVLKRGMVVTILFALMIFIMNILSPSGEILFKKGPFILGDESIKRGLLRAIRLVVLVWGGKVLFWRFTPEEIFKAIERLLGPLGRRKSIKGFIEIGLLTLKALPGVKRELQRLYSESCRKGSLLIRVRSMASIVVTILIKAIETPEEFF